MTRFCDAFSEIEMHYKTLAGIQPPLDLSTKVFGCEL
jgi:isopentenyl diphosphate isomerase/L-lactate dehydrogenase-like FMN-dependent dehydrogenase